MFILCEVEMETSPRISLLGWPGGLVAGLARPAVPARVLSANSKKGWRGNLSTSANTKGKLGILLI
jgi:hypothetical protein